jgi:hypothetical protein
MPVPGPTARKSSSSSVTGCVIVEQAEDGTIRTWSDRGDAEEGAVTEYLPVEWRAFIEGAKAGEFDIDADGKLTDAWKGTRVSA